MIVNQSASMGALPLTVARDMGCKVVYLPGSRSYYDCCRARGKTHTQALARLARHRFSVLFATLRHVTFYEHRTPRLA